MKSFQILLPKKAGLKAGDVITAMNGQKISSFAEMRAKIATSGAGKEIELTYLRDGKTDNVKSDFTSRRWLSNGK